jgi:hypothetical protein
MEIAERNEAALHQPDDLGDRDGPAHLEQLLQRGALDELLHEVEGDGLFAPVDDCLGELRDLGVVDGLEGGALTLKELNLLRVALLDELELLDGAELSRALVAGQIGASVSAFAEEPEELVGTDFSEHGGPASVSWGCAAKRSSARIAIGGFDRYFSVPPLPARANGLAWEVRLRASS